MKYPEEDIANELYQALQQEFESTQASITIKGRDNHWRCCARHNDSECEISCYYHRNAEYYTSFKRNSEEFATSRIPSIENTVAAVKDWLGGQELSELYEQYPFIDLNKRALKKMLQAVIARVPKLESGKHAELHHQFGEFYNLRFDARDRSCKIHFYGKNKLPDAKFSWDKCQLFQYQPDDDGKLADLLNRWIIENAMPSELRREFPWLSIGELADYYESGQPIEGEFLQSWSRIEEFYKEDWCNFSKPVLSMIHAIREVGYDRLLRAGQSMSALGLSRSRRHGMRQDQPCIWFNFGKTYMNIHADFASCNLKKHPIQLTNEVKQILDALVECEIN